LRTILVTAASLACFEPALAQDAAPRAALGGLSRAEIEAVSPALEQYGQHQILGDLWRRPELSPRDRSVVTVAVLIARGHRHDMPQQFGLALDNGLTPAELSEIITHLAFYSGWSNGTAAVAVAKDVFAQRAVRPDQLPAATPTPLPLNNAAEAQRAARVSADVGPVSPGLVKFTGELLFNDLWLRPDLAPRDRSLVTISALIASGQFGQLASHLNRAMDNGLTQDQVSDVITQLAFYAGWPNAFSAVPIVKSVFEARQK
jgi:4-carboxymuconolactone decarboxylase